MVQCLELIDSGRKSPEIEKNQSYEMKLLETKLSCKIVSHKTTNLNNSKSEKIITNTENHPKKPFKELFKDEDVTDTNTKIQSSIQE